MEVRLDELRAGLAGTLSLILKPTSNNDANGKGKDEQGMLAPDELV